MPHRRAAIANVAEAFSVIKDMDTRGLERGSDYRSRAGEVTEEILEGRIRDHIRCCLELPGRSCILTRRQEWH